jgi:Peptidase family M28/PDZ domain/PA domain
MLARKRWLRPALYVLCGVALLAATPTRAENDLAKKAATESEARLKRDVTELASDELEGRGPTTKGINLAAEYIAYQFKKAGLKPGNPDGTYFQPFDIPGSVLDEEAKLKLTGPQKQDLELKQGVQFWPMGAGSAGKGKDEALVFAGYGITNKTQKYDDYDGLDVEDKVVVVLANSPPFQGGGGGGGGGPNPFNQSGSFRTKIQNAQTHKAAAILIVNDVATAKDGDDLVDFNFTAIRQGTGGIPAFHVKRAMAEKLLKSGADLDLTAVEAEINKDLKPHSAELKGWTAAFEIKMRHDQIHVKNVIGVLEGSGELANETVVIGAHYDHLGYGGAGGSLARLKKMAIHHGADDNGSGSTAVMELARRFSEYRKSSADNTKPCRRLVFMTFSGEELGLLGSAHYCKNPIFPLENTYAMLNLDMVGRLPKDPDTGKDKLLVEGSTTAKSFDALVDKLNKKYEFEMKKSDSFIPNSDHFSFYQKKVPVLFFWTGTHPDYHRPTDTADKINVAGMRRIVDLSEDVLLEFATSDKKLEYVTGKARTGRGGGDYPRMGFTPDYNEGSDKGVVVSAVNDGEPAAKAGIKGGDTIVELAGKPIKNMEAYMEVIRQQKKGDTIEVVIEREGKKQTVKVKLE